MISKFKTSLGVFKNIQSEEVYFTRLNDEFDNKYVDNTEEIEKFVAQIYSSGKDNDSRADIDFLDNFAMNIYASFRFAYEIDDILDHIEVEGINLTNAENLLNLCHLLAVTSSSAMIYSDDSFSMNKQYTLCEDIFVMAKNIYDTMLFCNSTLEENKINNDETITITKYDEIENRLNCKYIRSSISVMKLFLILATLQKSPVYTTEVNNVSSELMLSLREVLFNKRIIKFIVDSDLLGENYRSHKTTRLKIYFSMSNSDRYCIRLDFPHDEEKDIHLNLNQPGSGKSTGFPFDKRMFNEINNALGNTIVDKDLFYNRDTLFWFKSDYKTKIKKIGKENPDLESKLSEFQHERGHIAIASDSEKKNVSQFSSDFAEALIDYELAPNIFGSTDENDDYLFLYILFLDYIYDVIIKLRRVELSNAIQIAGCNIFRKGDLYDIEAEAQKMFYKYIEEKFPNDIELNNLIRENYDFCTFIMKCIDCIEKNI